MTVVSSDEVSMKKGKGPDKKTTARVCKRKPKKQRTPKVPVKRRMLKKAEISDIKKSVEMMALEDMIEGKLR